MERVAIIIVNFNGMIFLKKCLTSVFNQDYPNFEVFLVDNGSTDESISFVKRNFPQVKIISLDKNYDVTKGHNIGMGEALKNREIRYVALLNNDTEVENDWLSGLVRVMSLDKKVGICASKILKMDYPEILDSTGHIFKYGRVVDRGNNEIDNKQYDHKLDVMGACGAACLYRREMLENIGLFDESFVRNYEDAELSWRAKNCGWKAKFVPASIAYHKGHGTITQNKELNFKAKEFLIPNLIKMIRRHATLRQKLWITLIWFRDIYRIRLFLQRIKLLWFSKII